MEFKSKHSKSLTLILCAAVVMTSCMVLLADASDAETSFDITDGTGQTFHFDAPSEHVVTAGVGATLTVVDAGHISKIVAVDKYSTYDYTKYDKLKDLKAQDLKSFYGTTNHDYIKTELVNMVSAGKLGLHDAIILTSYSSNTALRTLLEAEGFDHVLVWTTISDFDGIVDFVKAVSKIVNGSQPSSVTQMDNRINDVKTYVAAHPDAHPKALYVYSSSGTVKVGNTGIMKTMLDLCGAENIGYKEGSGTSYGDANTIVSLLEGRTDTVVFVQNSYFASGKTLDDFYNDVFNGDRTVKVVPMGLNWNNWCPEAAEGLYEIAHSLYGEDFDRGSGPGPSKTITYVAIGGVVAALAIGAVLAFRKH